MLDWRVDIFHATGNTNLRREVQGGIGEHAGGRPGISDTAGLGQDGGCSVPSTSRMARKNQHRKSKECSRVSGLDARTVGKCARASVFGEWLFLEHTVSPMCHLELEDETPLNCLWRWALLVNLSIALSLTHCCSSRCALASALRSRVTN